MMKNRTICIVFVLFFTLSSQAGMTLNKTAIGIMPQFSPQPMSKWSVNNFDMMSPFSFTRAHFIDTFAPVMDLNFGKKGLNDWRNGDTPRPFGRPGFMMDYHSHRNRIFIPNRDFWMTPQPKYDPRIGWVLFSSGAEGMFLENEKVSCDIPFDSQMGFSSVNSGGTVPSPGALLLGSIGVALVSWLRRNRTL